MKFMSNEEGRCPICNSQMIEYFGMELEDTAVYYPWHCPDCDTDGKEWYYVNFSEVRSNDDTIGDTQGVCPDCGAEIEYGTAEPEGNSLGYEYFCPECENSGTEWYDLDFDSHTINGHEDEEIDVVKESKSVNDIETELNSKVAQYKKLKKVNKDDTSKSKDLEDEIEDLEAQLKKLKKEDIDYKNDRYTATTAEDSEEERAYYGKNMTKRDKVRSLDQAKRNLDRLGKDPRVTQGQAVDQVSFDDKALDTDLSRYKTNKEWAKKSAEKDDEFWTDEHNKTAKQFADKIRAKHKKEETKDIWYSVELYGPSGNDRYDVTDTYKEAIASKKKGEKEYPNCRFEIVKMNGSIPTQKVNKKEINEGLEINKPQNKPVQAVEVICKDKSMLFKTNQVSGVFVDARKFMIPFANELNLEVEDIKDINVNVIYEDGEKSSVRIKPFDYQDTAYERYKALGGTEVFGQFQDWYSFNGYDEYGNKVRRKKHSKLNGYANDGSQKRLSVENKKQEDIEDNEEENDINIEDTISLLDIALKEIPTIGVEDWGKDDELLFTADTKVMFENLKNYEEEIPKYYYDNASNDDWSNGIDSYLEEIKGVDLNSGDSDNTYNWNAPLTHDVEFTIYEADDGCYFKGSIHRAGDVRGNYTTEFLLKFVDKDDCLETLFDTCSENCYRSVTVDDVEYVVSPHFFNEYVDIWNTKTQESYDDVYCDCIDKLKEIIAENKNSEE